MRIEEVASTAAGNDAAEAQQSSTAAKRDADRHGRRRDAKPAEPDKPFKLGDLLEPFDPPPLEEIDKTAEWDDRPVLDGMEIMREQQEADSARRR